MTMTRDPIPNEDPVELASLTDSALMLTRVFRGRHDGYAIVRRSPWGSYSVQWCPTAVALYAALSRRLGAGDFALIGYRLLGKVR